MEKNQHIEHIVADFLHGRLSAKHRRKFLTLVKELKDIDKLSAIHSTIFAQIDALSESELNQFQTLLKNEDQPTRDALKLHQLWKFAAAAAVVLCLGLYATFNNTGKQKPDDHAYYTNGTAKNYELPDGTHVELDANSQIEIEEFNEISRTVRLKGTATFVVKPGTAPFTVHTENGYFTRVLGTKFKVAEAVGQFAVQVERGKVSVGKGEETIAVLMKGDAIKIDDQIELFSHKENPLVFDNTNLGDVITAVNRAYDAQIQLGTSVDKNLKCKATFEKDLSVTDIVDVLCELYGYSYTIEGDRIIIRSK
ncbi:FecR family protein [Sphingobacterium pedocola]|uniref:FecR protein domain-containing protein n=1 Tax=Sphingobacterium pedocola TaxID=2082722 RepID=A0ABR9T768_9SPHI|nr:FecR domain-containing protein [Sphingobacterium pedocola]MBE8721201.1 hypothetical protein [Sphingobacterium pedocola]